MQQHDFRNIHRIARASQAYNEKFAKFASVSTPFEQRSFEPKLSDCSEPGKEATVPELVADQRAEKNRFGQETLVAAFLCRTRKSHVAAHGMARTRPLKEQCNASTMKGGLHTCSRTRQNSGFLGACLGSLLSKGPSHPCVRS